MKNFSYLIIISLFSLLLNACQPQGPQGTSKTQQGELFEERIPTLVVVKYFIQHEIERRPVTEYALVVNNEGLLVTLPGAIPRWVSDGQIQDVKVYPLGKDSEGFKAEYVGEDSQVTWHYFKVEQSHWKELKPITDFAHTNPRVADKLWGIGIIGFSETYYKPSFFTGVLSFIEKIPYDFCGTNGVITAYGGPVFTEEGMFAGWGMRPLHTSYVMQMNDNFYDVVLRRTLATETFIRAQDFYKYLLTDPETSLKKALPWMGMVGIESLSYDTLKFLNLENQGALVVSTVIEDSPAEQAGIQAKDIITSIDGQPLPKLANSNDTITAFHLFFKEKEVGEMLQVSIIRGDEKQSLSVTLGTTPKLTKEAPRQYFPRSGLTVREFVYDDALNNQIYKLEFTGVIAQFVRPNSPADSAELNPGDWIQEIDGTAVNTYEEAIALLQTIENDETHEDMILLVERDNETKVLRVKLN